MKLNFTINGNTEYPNGEPGDKNQWSDYVRECFYKQCQLDKVPVVYGDDLVDALLKNMGYPIRPANGYLPPIDIHSFDVSMEVNIYWAENSGSSTIIFLEILGALISNNKTLKSASFTSQMSDDKKGRVDVTIRIE